jgi:hypothetical protein
MKFMFGCDERVGVVLVARRIVVLLLLPFYVTDLCMVDFTGNQQVSNNDQGAEHDDNLE